MSDNDYPRSAFAARARADTARAKAADRRETLRVRVIRRRAIDVRTNARAMSLDYELNQELSNDSAWRAAVSDNQWWLAQTTAYGVTEIVGLLKFIVEQNNELLKHVKEM
jgi:hypothetical protein